MVQIHSDLPLINMIISRLAYGALAQLGEHLLCKQGVIGSIPIRSTKSTIPGGRPTNPARFAGAF